MDVVSYNTLLKAHLRTGNLNKARALLKEMTDAGVQSNQVTYNEMLNALVSTRDRKGMWALVELVPETYSALTELKAGGTMHHISSS